MADTFETRQIDITLAHRVKEENIYDLHKLRELSI